MMWIDALLRSLKWNPVESMNRGVLEFILKGIVYSRACFGVHIERKWSA